MHITSFPTPAVRFSQVMCGPVPAGPILVPSSTTGGRGGPMRHGVKRKQRPLSRHKYHNSILNNASLLGRGLTRKDTYTRHKGENTHTQIVVFNSPFVEIKSGKVVQLSESSFVMHLIYYETKTNSYNWDCHRRVSIVLLFYCGLWCHWILLFWLFYRFCGSAYTGYGMTMASSSVPGESLLWRTHRHGICER